MLAIALLSLFFAAFPALLYFRNTKLFCQPKSISLGEPPRISVLIPARNEAAGIAACVEAVLENVGVELEVIVLDDQSTDDTASIVRTLGDQDRRVRVESAPPLPAGWSGKQHACFSLAGLAQHPILTFLDADVRLSPDALSRMAGFLRTSGAALVSGFPRQETGTILEKLIVPLINWLLLSYLPLSQMRSSRQVGFGVGCGQWFMTTAEAYQQVGGHSHPLVRGSYHDGLKLPRAYRTCGLMTDLCDATNLAVCRMYRGAGQVWNGFAKNAREGMAAFPLILIWTLLLCVGYILPLTILLSAIIHGIENDWWIAILAGLALFCNYLPRLHAVRAFRQSVVGAILHPLGVACLLGIQWYATVRWLVGRPVGWKGRSHPQRLVKN